MLSLSIPLLQCHKPLVFPCKRHPRKQPIRIVSLRLDSKGCIARSLEALPLCTSSVPGLQPSTSPCNVLINRATHGSDTGINHRRFDHRMCFGLLIHDPADQLIISSRSSAHAILMHASASPSLSHVNASHEVPKFSLTV